jgi:LuxR family quorum sensing-dependent transcriptional regulator
MLLTYLKQSIGAHSVGFREVEHDKPSIDVALLENVFRFAAHMSELDAPPDVLAKLGTAINGRTPLKVLGAARIPVQSRDWLTARLGETVFLSEDVPRGWWEEYANLCQTYADQDLMMARTSLAPFTWTESRRMLEPIGIDRWPYDLAFKYGMRDGLTCPVGRRWIVAFWSPKPLSKCCDQESRAIIFLAANFTALRLEQLGTPDARRVPRKTRLTPRELAVLRLSSLGRQVAEIGEALSLGEETVRSHLKKAQQKLGTRNRTQTVAEALRQHLIP